MLQDILRLGSTEMGRPIEIEFAANVDEKGERNMLYWLQIRPIVDTKEMQDDNIADIRPEDCLIYSTQALGHGLIQEVRHVVYVKPETFASSQNPAIAREVEEVNDWFIEHGEGYVLMGPGRWGSEDRFLGIPVKWPHISQARVIVETALSNYRVEPSQGTHFFQNLTSFGVGYFTMSLADGRIDQAALDAVPAVMETPHVRVVRFDKPLDIKINGTKSIGVVMVDKE
jgi:hypothetical protein